MRQPGRAFAACVLALAAILSSSDSALAAEDEDKTETETGTVTGPGTGWTLFPVPFVSTNPNEGTKYGLILALLQQENGYTQGIFAPSVSYSKTLGLQGTFRYYGYPKPGVKEVVIGSYGTELEQESYLYYDNRTLGSNVYEVEVTAFMNNARTARFFGIGSGTSEKDETNFTLQDFGANLRGGIMLGRNLQLSLLPRVRKVNVLNGILEDVPSPAEAFPETPGLGGATTLGWGAQIKFDTRDNVDMPVEGIYASGFGEISVATHGSHGSFERFGLDLRAYFSGQSRKFVTAVRGMTEIVTGADVPFFEQSQLGGPRQLRAFPEGRWTDRGKVLVSIEERIRFLEVTIFDVFTQFEGALFGDFGKVFHVGERFFEDFQPVGGGGLRFLVPPNVVATVDVGYGTEGLAIFAILGYPY